MFGTHQKKINYTFIPEGSIIEENGDYFSVYNGIDVFKWPVANTLIFDTGSKLSNGIFDHHFYGASEYCTAQLVVQDLERGKIINNKISNSNEINIVTHYLPDFDACASIYIFQMYITGTYRYNKIYNFLKYVNIIDTGRLKLNRSTIYTAAPLLLQVSQLISSLNLSISAKSKKIVEEAEKIFDVLMNSSSKYQDIYTFSFELINKFEKYTYHLKTDFEKYTNYDIKKSIIDQIKLMNVVTGQIEKVDFIFTEFPVSALWKYWTRGDTENSLSKHGFICTCAFYKKGKSNRAIIAVDPNTPYNLQGLGAKLEKLELIELDKNGLLHDELVLPKRPGYKRNDPWYDGRNSLHNYTIIDSPRRGTFLTKETIIGLIKDSIMSSG